MREKFRDLANRTMSLGAQQRAKERTEAMMTDPTSTLRALTPLTRYRHKTGEPSSFLHADTGGGLWTHHESPAYGGDGWVRGNDVAKLEQQLEAHASLVQEMEMLADRWRDPEFWKDRGATMDSMDCAADLLALLRRSAAPVTEQQNEETTTE